MNRETSAVSVGKLGRALTPVLFAGQCWLTGSTAYLLALLAAGARYAPSAPGLPPPVLPRIAVLVPAHDEEQGISPVVEALVNQKYPDHRFEVIVIADNCTDRTAEVAGRAGATVWTRVEPEARGKGQALSWALRRLQSEPERRDVVVVVDADCLASSNLCSVIGARMTEPDVHALQVRYEVSNPEDSPTAALRAAGFILKHVIRSRGRARLGLSCGLFGSGMAFRTEILEQVGWPTSVTEDTELHLRLVERSVVVKYVEDASVRSVMPTTATAAVEQQLRWETGNAQLAKTYALRLVARAVRESDGQLLAAAAELLVPSQSLLAAGCVCVGAVSAGLRQKPIAALAAITLAAQTTYVVGGLLAAGAPPSSLRALTASPGFIARRLQVLSRVAAGRGAKTWVRTTRER